MRYWVLTGVVTLASFAIWSLIASIAVAAVSPTIAHRLRGYSPASRASALFKVRLAPAAVATVMAFGVTLPTFLWLEDANTDEPVSWTLAVGASTGALLLACGAARAWLAWRATRRVALEWHRRARPLDDAGAPIPAFAIDEPFPLVAVIGVWRPVLFIAEQVLRECGQAEIRAMVAHEVAHLGARDNLRRFVMRAAPDCLGASAERAWAAAAEESADAAAVLRQPACGLDLAHALVRVARLAPMQAPALASAFYLGGGIETRVRRLVDPPEERELKPLGWRRLAAIAALFASAVVLGAPYVHEILEQAVQVLP